MSGSVNLNINTGADWAVRMTWTDGNGNPVVFDTPVMDIRQEKSSTGNAIASLDSTGNLNGTISQTGPGELTITMTKEQTKNLQTGYGFWDIFVNVNSYRVKFAFGTVQISPHVTAV